MIIPKMIHPNPKITPTITIKHPARKQLASYTINPFSIIYTLDTRTHYFEKINCLLKKLPSRVCIPEFVLYFIGLSN
jgi:hypothetical protein